MHVSGGIHMNQETDTGNDKHHDQRNAVEVQGETGFKGTDCHPCPECLGKRSRAGFSHGHEIHAGQNGDQKRKTDRPCPDNCSRKFR